ncbi:T9SS type A sorting domain-containing protein [Spirosoma montaniterrae]|uniref:Sialate O-acetylesterase domain-containing protein n=1 Tax=Spirosoma montaniterrae TaxID=1178516 RepID=A0A1P9X0M7_9BACT|nr:T9SS type A sorting domain-containing protein [Spirosoma montaniterrae]AQG81189.1 hypothetical protein AWR27_18810 [Spirosoma montaniterrae]
MKHFSLASVLVAALLLPLLTLAQIQVSFPTTRAVFQRDNANQATFRVMGYYTSPITRVEARLQARDGRGTSFDWRTIQSNPTGGVYAGDLQGQGGWYNLQVRGMNGDQQVGEIFTVERVGVGEVFIIAGQSNAQGIHYDAPNPGNDLVNCVNYKYPNEAFPNDPPKPEFTKLDNTPGFTIAPRGVGSWCWGMLGDLLVKRLNVPVMFFNGAFQGTPVRNWRESAPEGGTAISIYNGDPFPPRQPYINLKLSLQFYASALGARAVLWHQGEADNLIFTSTNRYVNELQFVINQSRQDFGRPVPWVVARASYGDLISNDGQAVIAGQNQVIATTPNVFAGPSTDNIQIPRRRPPLNDPDAVHFDMAGLMELANAWNASLDDAFFQRSVPVAGITPPTVSVACAANNNLTFTINGQYSSVQWESGETTAAITKGAGGLYRAKVKDALGNTFFTPQVRVSDAPAASVVGNRPPSICVGNSLALTSNYDNATWLNQQTGATVTTGRSYTATTAGAYFVRVRDVSGCDFNSNVINLAVNPLPATPVVANERPTTFCQGDNTVLRASADNVQYNWNAGGQQSKSITINTSGSFFLTVTDQNGCTSASSNTVVVTANPVPAKPTISASGPTTFCADRNVTLTAPQEAAYVWTNGASTRAITVNQTNDYSVRLRNQFNCVSEPSDAIRVLVNPLPPTPTITAGGPTTFCEGNRVTLTANSANDVVWASGQITRNIIVSTAGIYAVQARDQNGCLSTFSPVVAVRVNALPAAPTILTNRPPTICEGDQIRLRIDGPFTVFWSTGDSTQSITTGRAGNYSARVRDVNGCISPQSAPTAVELRPLPPAPTVNIVGTYTLEAISSTNGTEFRWRRGTDSLATSSAVIKANQSGSYTARSSIVYSPTLTCFSLPSAPLVFTVDLTNNGLSVYPNPNPDKIVRVELRENLTDVTLTLYSLRGEVLRTFNVPIFDERKALELTYLPAGSYVLRVQARDFDASKRIVIGL